MSVLEPLGPNLWLQRHPLLLAGCRMGRNVSVIRLESGKLVIHSTAPFSPADVEAIRNLGEPGWLVEATKFHDTCSAPGRAAFPDLPYLAPAGFPAPKGESSPQPILPAPAEWSGEVEVLRLAGMPSIDEHILFHRPSKTLIVADLLFNLPPSAGAWTLGFFRILSGIQRYPGMSRLFLLGIRDREAFTESLRELAELDFDRLVVAHGDPIEEGAREIMTDTWAARGFRL